MKKYHIIEKRNIERKTRCFGMLLNSKFLVKSLVWIVALLAMNQAYADNHLKLGVADKKETSNLQKNLDKKPNLKTPNTPLKSEDKKLNLNLDLSILDKPKGTMEQNNTVMLPKTHYGVGYEYRRSMRMQRQKRDQAESPQRVAHPRRMQRSERANRSHKPNRR